MSSEAEQTNRQQSEAAANEASLNTVSEGKARVCIPGSKDDVFYNPVQEFNRDLSITALRVFALKHLKEKEETYKDETFLKEGEYYENGVTVLEALAASGLRSIRYAKEVGGIKNIVANDLSTTAVDSIKLNTRTNEVTHLVTANEGDATTFMYQHRSNKSKFHCVDLDPYGSPVPFIDAAVQCVSDGGLLMVTATDMAILCGNVPETCYAKYGSMSLKSKACHEMALRILLKFIATSAARYGRYIHPLLSVSVDFYIRIFVQVYTGKKECKATASKCSMVYQCVGCHALYWQSLMKSLDKKFIRTQGPPTGPECEICHSRLTLGGPFYSEPIHDMGFVQSMLDCLDHPETGSLKTEKRIRGVLTVVSEELPDIPLYYCLDYLASTLRLSVPSLVKFRSAILHAGYRVSLSHCHTNSIKTDAPISVIWDLFQGFAKTQYPDKPWPRPLPESGTPSVADYILSRKVTTEADFTLHPEANPESRKMKLVRFQENPERYWGPKARAKTNFKREDTESKNKKPRLDDNSDVQMTS